MKLDLKNILNDAAEMEKLSIQKSTDNSDTTVVSGHAKYTYLIVDGSNLGLAELEDEILTDRSTVLLAALQLLFADDSSRFQQLCNNEFDTMGDHGRSLDSWLSDKHDQLMERFDFLEGMRPYTPTDMVHTGNTFLIEMTYVPEDPTE